MRAPGQLRTGPSPIAGTGVFAAVAITAGTALDAVGANHGCDPNLWWSGAELLARRDIAEGEELTFDYATGVPGGSGSVAGPEPMPADALVRCNCGSTRCRGLIEASDRDIPELQRRYADHFASPG